MQVEAIALCVQQERDMRDQWSVRSVEAENTKSAFPRVVPIARITGFAEGGIGMQR